MTETAEVNFDVQNGLGMITLNRPKALNALNHNMCRLIDDQLQLWDLDDQIKAVLIKGEGGRAFCAGGDVKSLIQAGTEKSAESTEFFRTEYQMNARIFHFSKPYISFLDGVTMGGGAGVSLHGSHPIVTENTLFAMPEVGIGLFPDVGGSYFLPKLAGKIGLYLALTGARIKAGDCIYAGIGSAFIKSENLSALTTHLIDSDISTAEDVDGIIARFAEIPPEAPLDEFRDIIDAAFAEESIHAIIDHLEAIDHEFSDRTLINILDSSNISKKVILEVMKRAEDLSFDDCMKMEFRISSYMLSYDSDFYRGVTALLIEKTGNPKWNPATLQDVTDEMVDRHFSPVQGGDLQLT